MILIPVVAVLAIIALAVVVIYNGLVRLNVQAGNAWADIDVQLKRRYDLIPNVVETVKGYASHERQTLEAVVNARCRCRAPGPPSAGRLKGPSPEHCAASSRSQNPIRSSAPPRTSDSCRARSRRSRKPCRARAGTTTRSCAI